jgi:lipopolysaccharide biosynthesis protein
MVKTLVLYVFHTWNSRVKHFLETCIFYDETIDFVVICNDKHFSFQVPTLKNVRKVQRDNIGYDFGGWSEALLENNVYKNYDSFVFVNSSVMGPYFPPGYRGKWTDIYLDGLQGDIKLFGSTINTCRNPLTTSHVQSYIFSMNQTTLQFLMDEGIFSITNYAKTFDEAIWQKEVLMSQKIVQHGWNIGSRMRYYQGVDFRFRDKKPSDYTFPFLDDIMYPQFRNKIWNEHVLVFIKGNRVPL